MEDEEQPLLAPPTVVEGLALSTDSVLSEGENEEIHTEQEGLGEKEQGNDPQGSTEILVAGETKKPRTGKKELTKPRALEDSVVYRDEIVREMLKSEKKYIADLTLLIEVFLIPLRESGIISREQIQSLFSTVELLVGLNKELFKEMEVRAAAWDSEQSIGDVFLMLAPHFKIYTSYCRNYEQAMATLQVCRTNLQFVQFLEEREKLPEVQKQDLTSFLILPVQRIPRYILLLKDLKQNTSPQHPDYENISKAVEQYTEVTKTVNESIRNAERTNELLEIQRLFGRSYEIVKPARVFVKRGKLTKITSRFVKETWFFLFNDVLIYAYEVVGSFVFKGEIELGTSWIRDLIDTPSVQNAFQIVSSKKTYTVYASSTEDKKSWVMAIQKCIAGLVAKKPELIEQRADINVRRSWLSWLPETVGLTYAPEQFDPHGAGYAAASRSSLSKGNSHSSLSKTNTRSSLSGNDTRSSLSRNSSKSLSSASPNTPSAGRKEEPEKEIQTEKGGLQYSIPQPIPENEPLLRRSERSNGNVYHTTQYKEQEECCACVIQ